MEIARKILCKIVVAALMSLGVISGVHAQQGGIPGSFGGELRGVTQFTARVVCVGCDLTEARRAQPHMNSLYQLNYDQGQLVMQVESFSESSEHRKWESIVGLSHQLQGRATDTILKEITAEENLFRPMTVTGLLRSTNTLDIDSVKIED